MKEINVELLIGRDVYDVDNQKVGCIGELEVRRDGNACLVDAYRIASSAFIDRLDAWSLIRPIGSSLRARKIFVVYRVPWAEMDFTDPERPKVMLPKSELRHAK